MQNFQQIQFTTKTMQAEANSTVLIFFINGVNALLGWNAVLAALDYFANSFSQYNVYSFLPVPLFVAYILVGVLFHIISNRFQYKNIIIVGNTIIFLSLIAILLVSIIFDQTTIGYTLMLICAFFIGIGGNLSQLSFFAMINYLSQNVVSKFTVGTAVSGLFITGVRVVITLIFGVEDKSSTPIIIYFVIALAFNVMDMFLNIYFCNSKIYKNTIEPFTLQQDMQTQTASMLQSDQANSTDIRIGKVEDQNYFKTLYDTLIKIKPYPFYIMFTFVITFTLYPGPTFVKPFDNIDNTWAVILFNVFYNIGDTVGKYVAELKGAFNPMSLAYVFFARLFFFFPVTFMAKNWDKDDPMTNNDFFPFFNILLFAITNGFCINASFIMAFKVSPLQYKKYAGVLCGLILQLGIILGTIIEIPYSYIIGIN